MKLTNFTDYSFRALIYLTLHEDRLCTVKEISSRFSISYNHMVKVVHSLSQHGYILAKKGKGGGLQLAKSPEEINLGEVVRILEPDFYIVECFDSSTNQCSLTPVCQLKYTLNNAKQAFLAELDKHTLAEMVINKDELLVQFTA